MLETEQDKAVSHLEFLGFDVKTGDKLLAAKHSSKPSFYISFFDEGMVFTALYTTSDAAKQDPYRLLKYVNSVNEKTMVVRLFVNEAEDVYLAAFYPRAYDKLFFANFLEYWESDVRKMAASSESSQMLQ